MDDRQIIELYHQRDEKAISETANKYGNYCFSIAYNILANEQDCEECVNDTWLRAWDSMPPEWPNYLKLFLAKITRNLSLNKLKAANRINRGGGEITVALEEISEFVSGASDVESRIEEEELMSTVNRFLRSLPARDCNLFIRRYFHVDPISQIAEMYGMTEWNVRKVLSRTRQKLKTHLESEGYII